MKPSFPILLYLVFVFGLISLARLAMQSPPDLVCDDYYERGLAHDETLTAEFNARELAIAPVVTQTPTGLRIQAPIDEATLLLHRPADSALDREIALSFRADSAECDLSLSPGLWRYTLLFTHNSLPCQVRGSLHK